VCASTELAVLGKALRTPSRGMNYSRINRYCRLYSQVT